MWLKVHKIVPKDLCWYKFLQLKIFLPYCHHILLVLADVKQQRTFNLQVNYQSFRNPYYCQFTTEFLHLFIIFSKYAHHHFILDY